MTFSISNTPIMPSPKLILASFDVDETLLPHRQGRSDLKPYFPEAYSRWLKQPEVRQNLFLLLNTGRNLHALQQLTAHVPELDTLSIDGLSVLDGAELYRNTKHEPAGSWIAQLKEADQDTAYKATLEDWNSEAVIQHFQRWLKEEGYLPNADADLYQRLSARRKDGVVPQAIYTPSSQSPDARAGLAMLIFPGSTHFQLTSMEADNSNAVVPLEQASSRLARSLEKSLQAHWPTASLRLNTKTTPYPRVYLAVTPSDKAKVTDYVASHWLVEPKAVITAGDSANDIPLLERECFHDASNKEVPNFSIQIGEHSRLSEALQKKERLSKDRHIKQVKKDGLDSALEAHWQRVQPYLPDKSPATFVKLA